MHHHTTAAAGHRRSSRATHTLTNPHGRVWILATPRDQFLRAVTADTTAEAAAQVGLGGDEHHHWLRRGPGRYSRVPIPTNDLSVSAQAH